MMRTLNDFLQETRVYVDEGLAGYLSVEEPLLRGLRESVGYSVFSGGKRIRPAFCFLVGELFSVPRERLLSVACSVEMIHTASLIMDDLPHMDNERLRRGKQANHLVFGQDVASLASIGLLMKAYEIVLDDPGLPAGQKAPVVSRLAGAVGFDGMVGGQYADLKHLNASTGFETLEFIHLHKTASLFVASGEASAIVGGASAREMDAVRAFARNVGFAFQVLDDLLDASGDEKAAGKTLRKDKGNFVSLLGIERSKELMRRYTGEAVEALGVFKGREEKLIALGRLLLGRSA